MKMNQDPINLYGLNYSQHYASPPSFLKHIPRQKYFSDHHSHPPFVSPQGKGILIIAVVIMEGLDRAAAVGVKRSGSSKYNECAKALRAASVLDPKSGSPLLLLSPEEGGCRVYDPRVDRFYETKSDFSGYRFLASSGKWFLVVDSQDCLYIVDVFSEERINLPHLESIKGGLYNVVRADNNEFKSALITDKNSWAIHTTEYLRGLLWVDDNTGDHVVVWQFEEGQFLGFCKKGDDHYRDIPIREDVLREFRGLKDVVLKGYSLYYLATRGYVRHLDLSGQDGFEDVSGIPRFPMARFDFPCADPGTVVEKVISFGDRLAVTTSNEVLLAFTKAYQPIYRIFRVYKRDFEQIDPNTCETMLNDMKSIGDEALFFDLGITVPAAHTLGIEPNSIYFTRNDRFGHKKFLIPCLDICIYNIATRTIKRFPILSDLKLKDAQWFLPS